MQHKRNFLCKSEVEEEATKLIKREREKKEDWEHKKSLGGDKMNSLLIIIVNTHFGQL